MRKPIQLAIPLDLQMFASDGGQGDAGQQSQENNQGQQNNQQNSQGTQQVEFDYDKLASIVSGKQQVAEETVLKNYFKQQGMTQDEVNTAISTFKQQKAESTPDVNQIQEQLKQQEARANQYMIENVATLEALGLGIDQKTIPYVLKMADLSNVIGEDGKLSKENINKALSKVLEDVPQLKPATQVQQQGGFQIGAGNNQGTGGNDQDMLAKIFGNK